MGAVQPVGQDWAPRAVAAYALADVRGGGEELVQHFCEQDGQPVGREESVRQEGQKVVAN